MDVKAKVYIGTSLSLKGMGLKRTVRVGRGFKRAVE